ncbi:MAG: rod shape-determining protein RodA [Acidobacteriota bacterium]|nr:rod shape-determining protein RodA [Acidobacteriota bacterium]
MLIQRFLNQFDYLLFLAVTGLIMVGIVEIYHISAGAGDFSLFMRHLIWVGMGVLLCLLIIFVDYRHWIDHAFLLYILTAGLLLCVLLFGREINGSKSWFTIGAISFQPSEISKVTFILVLARYLSGISGRYLRLRHLSIIGLLTLCPMVLITLQGDLGTALIYLPVVLCIVMVAGLKKQFLIGIPVLMLLMSPLSWFFLEDYQKERILVTIDPGRDPQGIGYQSRQSQIAIGSGGLLGKGLGQGLQSQLGFVPEIRTDFIFSILAEETGLAGSIVVLMLYLLVLVRFIRIAESAGDRVGIFLIVGIASLFFFHVAVNVSMTMGIVPPIGIPLPWLSYGGSFTITNFVALGMAFSVHQRRFACSSFFRSNQHLPRPHLPAPLHNYYNN